MSVGGADDDRQRDRAREQVRLVAREAPPARRREGDAVAGDARRQRRGLGDAERQAVRRRRLAATPLLWPACRRPASPPPRRAGRSAVARGPPSRSLDRPLQRVADDRRGQEGEAEDERPTPVEARAALRRSVRRWPISSAAAAPVCSATSKLLRTSGSIASQSQPAARGRRTMWAELETGSSSAGPWTMPSATARRAGIRPSTVSLKRRPAAPSRPPRRARRRRGRRRAAA